MMIQADKGQIRMAECPNPSQFQFVTQDACASKSSKDPRDRPEQPSHFSGGNTDAPRSLITSLVL